MTVTDPKILKEFTQDWLKTFDTVSPCHAQILMHESTGKDTPPMTKPALQAWLQSEARWKYKAPGNVDAFYTKYFSHGDEAYDFTKL